MSVYNALYYDSTEEFEIVRRTCGLTEQRNVGRGCHTVCCIDVCCIVLRSTNLSTGVRAILVRAADKKIRYWLERVRAQPSAVLEYDEETEWAHLQTVAHRTILFRFPSTHPTLSTGFSDIPIGPPQRVGLRHAHALRTVK